MKKKKPMHEFFCNSLTSSCSPSSNRWKLSCRWRRSIPADVGSKWCQRRSRRSRQFLRQLPRRTGSSRQVGRRRSCGWRAAEEKTKMAFKHVTALNWTYQVNHDVKWCQKRSISLLWVTLHFSSRWILNITNSDAVVVTLWKQSIAFQRACVIWANLTASETWLSLRLPHSLKLQLQSDLLDQSMTSKTLNVQFPRRRESSSFVWHQDLSDDSLEKLSSSCGLRTVISMITLP